LVSICQRTILLHDSSLQTKKTNKVIFSEAD